MALNTVEKNAGGAAKAASPRTHATATATAMAARRRRVIRGVVVSDKMRKTIVVRVDRRVKDPLYMKFVTKTGKFKAHDEKNEARIGDLVELVESKPLSREKRWVLRSVLRRGNFTPEVAV